MKKILLIDDSDTYMVSAKYLQHRGYPVKTASTLKEGAGRHPRGNAAGGLL